MHQFTEVEVDGQVVSIADIQCPQCSSVGYFTLEQRIKIKPFGTWSLAGMTEKVAARSWLYLVCGNCKAGWEAN